MIIWIIVAGGFLILWLFRMNRNYCVMAFFSKRIKTTDGSSVEDIAPNRKGTTIFANTFDIIGLNSLQLFEYNRSGAQTIRKSYVEYVLGETIYNVIKAKDAESVMNDVNLITKGLVYEFLKPFLRTGLLISTDKKWHARRKMLTPAFHFNILEQFEEIFKEESKKFVEALRKGESLVSLSKIIPKFTLNNVCETALGVQLDDCLDGENYRKSFKMIEECFIKRISNPFFMNDKLFHLLEGRKYAPHLKIVHEFSSEIIEKRRRLFAEETQKVDADDENDDLRFTLKKKRYAMLDTLLHAERDGLIDHVGICEEVDTFMFEGFDTTSMGLTFALMNMSLYPELQERCYQEIEENIHGDLGDMSALQINQLKYLECFLKESLRLFPPVPVILRTAIHDSRLSNKLYLPAGTQIAVHIFDIHRDPHQYPNPDVFDPDRFTLENSTERHPFAFMPFSAGPRNCIGQKFAMLEMKTLLVYILKSFKILPVIDPKDITLEVGIIIRSFKDIKVQFEKRE